MGIAEDIAAVQKAHRSTRCPVAAAVSRLDADDAAALEAGLSNDDIMNITLTEVLRRAGYRIGGRAVGNHRRGICSCSEQDDD